MIDNISRTKLPHVHTADEALISNNKGRKLRILCLSSDLYPPFRVDVSILFGQELKARGHHFDWILQSQRERATSGEEQWNGFKVWVGKRKQGRSTLSKIYNFATSITLDLKAFAWSKTQSYDAIQVKDKFLAGIYGLIIARRRRIKFFYWLSYPFPEAWSYNASTGESRFPLLDRVRGSCSGWLLYKILLPHADHIFVQSDQMLKDVASRGIPSESMTAVPMGACLKRMPVATADSAEPYTIAYLGDLGKTRRIDFLLRSFSIVLKQLPQAKLFLIGGAEAPRDEYALHELADELGISASVEFTGYLPIEDAWDFALRAQIGVSPLYNTPIFAPASPTKVVEYLALGKPVVVNDHPDQKKIVEESGAGICTCYVEAEFAAGIIKLLEQQSALPGMGKMGKEYIEKHRSYEVLANLVEQKYLQYSK